jgi:hypothetical protein
MVALVRRHSSTHRAAQSSIACVSVSIDSRGRRGTSTRISILDAPRPVLGSFCPELHDRWTCVPSFRDFASACCKGNSLDFLGVVDEPTFDLGAQSVENGRHDDCTS